MMIYLNLPKPIRVVANNFNDMLENFSYKTFCGLVVFFLFGCDSLSDVVRCCPFSTSVSSMANAAKKFPFNRFQRRLLTGVLKKLKTIINLTDFIFVIDDTDNPKYGKFIFENGRWGSSKGKYLGQKIMVLAIVNLKTKVAILIAYKIIPKRLSKKDPSAIDYVKSLVKSALDAGYPKLTVVVDSWFDSVKLMEEIEVPWLSFYG